MYRLGHRKSHHYIIAGAVAVLAVGLTAAGVVVSRSIFQPHTVITQARPVTHTVLGDEVHMQQVSKSIFTFTIPADWHNVEPPHIAYTVYSWAGTTGIGGAQRLDVYIDNVPLNFAANRLQPVAANGDHFDVIGSTSDNCTAFTARVPDSVNTGNAPSKWTGVNFLCDVANYERDVVATGSAEGINIATLHGTTSGGHRVLLVYTDNNPSPDYTVFTNIIKSFHLI